MAQQLHGIYIQKEPVPENRLSLLSKSLGDSKADPSDPIGNPGSPQSKIKLYIARESERVKA